MNSLSAIALSGMNGAQLGLQVAAHNIANLGTPGFRRQQLVPSEATAGGVAAAVTRSDTPGASLETDVVGQLEAKNAFLANLAVFRCSDRTMGALLDAAA